MSTVVVAGGTGRLSAVAFELLRRGHTVRALGRNLGSPGAIELRKAGATVEHGDFDDPGALSKAIHGAEAVVASGTAHRAGPDGELRHSLNLFEAARRAGVPQLVWISGDGAERETGVPVFEAKRQAELHLAGNEIPATVLAPVYLMENLLNPWNMPMLAAGRLPTPIPPGQRLQQVALADVAQAVARAVEHPSEWVGRRVPLASDELTGHEAAAILSESLGRGITAQGLATDGLGPGLQRLFTWLRETGHTVDIASLHASQTGIRWHTFADWVSEQDWTEITTARITA
jgi:uncharacterized protein YbjT (DUF2867 family)